MNKTFSILRESVIMLLDSGSLSEENKAILRKYKNNGKIEFLTDKFVNTFIYYYDGDVIKIAGSNLSVDTYNKRLSENSPFIRL